MMAESYENGVIMPHQSEIIIFKTLNIVGYDMLPSSCAAYAMSSPPSSSRSLGIAAISARPLARRRFRSIIGSYHLYDEAMLHRAIRQAKLYNG